MTNEEGIYDKLAGHKTSGREERLGHTQGFVMISEDESMLRYMLCELRALKRVIYATLSLEAARLAAVLLKTLIDA